MVPSSRQASSPSPRLGGGGRGERALGRREWGFIRPPSPSLAFLAVFTLALAPRLLAPARFVTWDEPTWAERSTAFLHALESGDLARTFQREHPGVVTMWAGAAALAMSEPASSAVDDQDAPLNPMRAALALLTALAIALAWWLARPLVGPTTATTAAAILAFDPYLLAHSRVLHLDAVAALLALVAVLCLARWVDVAPPAPSKRWLIATGIATGLAVVEKSPMLVLGAFVAAVITVRIVVDVVRGRSRTRVGDGLVRWLDAGVVVAVAAAVTYVAVWPAMWVAPVETFRRMLAYAAEGAGQAREAVFLAGRVSPDPGIGLYLAAIPWRMTPLSLVGALVGVGVAVREARRGRWTASVLLAWAVVFVLAMGAGAKKFERYMLPSLPALDVVAAVGLVAVVDAARRWRAGVGRRRGVVGDVGILAALVVAQAVVVVAHHPYYLAWYNPLLGGGPAAARVLPVGWGEGSDLVVDWLNDQRTGDGLTVATASDTMIAHRFSGRIVSPKKWREADWLVVMIDDRQIGEPEEILSAVEGRPPTHVVRLNGIDYAWIWARP
ncbi:MAG: phospholipid carrier-dependent glycosyltransferase [Ardenticatenales bacterium]|nr:phospholipid carrier-dependent glycosyltransferase [Ardenticatenales bacterium]